MNAIASLPTMASCHISGDKPMIDFTRQFMMIFSPKAACSTAVIWFFHQMGLTSEARAHSDWPHHYRIERFYRRPDYLAAWQLPVEQLRILRIVRDPFDRAVSSFRHALVTGYADDAIQRALGIDVASRGLSFSQFIDFLEYEDIATCDPHHRQQVHPVEVIRPPDILIDVSRQALFSELNSAERQLAMPITDFRCLNWIHELQQSRAAPRAGLLGNTYRQVLSRAQAQRGPWPSHLLNRRARERLSKIYAKDISLYGYAAPAP